MFLLMRTFLTEIYHFQDFPAKEFCGMFFIFILCQSDIAFFILIKVCYIFCINYTANNLSL